MRTLAHPRSLARRPVRALLAQWPLALVDDVDGIHQARVASRRLRELVPALARTSEMRDAIALRRGLRNVTRLLGRCRELDVAMGTLQTIEARRPGLTEAIAAVRAHVVRERVRAGRDVRAHVGRVDIKGLASGTLALARHRESPPAIRACARRVSARLRRRAEELRLAVLRAGLIFAAGPLHGVRIALKKFRYALEAAERMGRFRLGRTLQRLKIMQDLLGDLHDLQVLGGLARDVMIQSPSSQRGEIEALVTSIDDDIRGLHSRFLSERERVIELLARAARVRRALLALPPPNLPQPRGDGKPTPVRILTRETEDR